jgi:hypothetical protein
MDQEFCRQQARRVRDLAERADPFTRKRLLALADQYDVRCRDLWRPSGPNERPLPFPLLRPDYERAGKA